MSKESWYRPIVSSYRNRKSRHLALQFSTILEDLKGEIPVIIICYNNGVYVENLACHFNKFNIKPIIIDNNSSDSGTIETLKKLVDDKVAYVAYSNKNFGHFVGFIDSIYKLLPNNFAYTDPDLQLNKDLPLNFIEELIQLTKKFQVYKAGFALSLLDNELIINNTLNISHTKPFNYKKDFSVRQYESKYWRFPVKNTKLEAHYAPIDTTFAIYNKNNYQGDFYDGIRVAGEYSAVHLPWFPDLDIMDEDQKQAYLNSDRKKDTTWVKK